MGKNGKGKHKNNGDSTSKNSLKLSQWAKIKIVCKVVRGKLQKAHTMGYLSVPGQESGRTLRNRLSNSCPSLIVEEDFEEEDHPVSCKFTDASLGVASVSHRYSFGDCVLSHSPPSTSGMQDNSQYLCPDTPKIKVNDSTPTGSEEFLLDVADNLGPNESIRPTRRKSCSAASVEEKKLPHHRSISLSSLDSDGEDSSFCTSDLKERSHSQGNVVLDNFRNSTQQRLLLGSSPSGAYSERSDGGSSTHSLNEAHLDNKTAKAGTQKPRFLTPRLTLQKSISTPSILAGVNEQSKPKEGSQVYIDENASKRRKRGSIFFRKKKDKKKPSHHQFVSVCYSISRNCDVCYKSLSNKSALRCEACSVCVHENSCMDQIPDCSKIKSNSRNSSEFSSKNHGLESSNNSSLASISSSYYGSSVAGSHGSSTSNGPDDVTADAKSQPAIGRSKFPSAYVVSSSSQSKLQSSAVTSPARRISGFSQWKRVATKLGVKKNPDENNETNPDGLDSVNIESSHPPSGEFIEDTPEGTSDASLENNDSDPELGLMDTEPESWRKTVGPEVVSQLNERAIKRQEAIYELIMTEKHHCRMLKILKKVFADGMGKELGLKDSLIKGIFPCLDELITIHFSFLWRLRERQRAGRYVVLIGDLLLEQFVGDNCQGLKDVYGLLCSSHNDAVSNYKEMLKNDRVFQSFIRAKSTHHLMRKKGLPECILFLSQRVTKYPLMIEVIVKNSIDQPEEVENLKKALKFVKEILVDINAQVAEKEKHQRLLEIYHRVDPKSSTVYKGYKIKKSDLLTDGRKLVFEGLAFLSQQRGKPLLVSVIVMSDMMLFLQENNQKYAFVSPDNKAGAIPLCKLLVREKAGDRDPHSIYVISGNQNEMYEFECHHPKDKRIWLDSIRKAVELCPEEEFGNGIKRNAESKVDHIHELLVKMQLQDKELAKICEERMQVFLDLVNSLGEGASPLDCPSYSSFLEENNLSPAAAKELQLTALREAIRLVASSSDWSSSLARSASSVGEHHSEAYVCPTLPKRAETFGGFDNPNKDGASPTSLPKVSNGGGKKRRESKGSHLSSDATDLNKDEQRRLSGVSPVPMPTSTTCKISLDNISTGGSSVHSSSDSSGNREQFPQAQLVHCLNTALVLSQYHFTQYEMCRAKLITGSSGVGGRFSHSQKLEELRNIQEQISHERSQWVRERDHQEKWISDKKSDLAKLQDSLRLQQLDINQQREDLYRKLEALKSQGIVLNPLLTVLSSSSSSSSLVHSQTDSVAGAPKPESSSAAPPVRPRPEVKHRNSTASLQSLKKDHSGIAPSQKNAPTSVKQQLPMKLAKLGSIGQNSACSTTTVYTAPSASSAWSVASPPSQEKRVVSSGDALPSQQMLPLKLREGFGGAGSKGPGGYQRLPVCEAGETVSNVSFASRLETHPSDLPPRQHHSSTFSSPPPVPPRISTVSPSLPETTPGRRVRDPESDQDIIFL